MIRRPPRSTLSSSSAASDVYKRQLRDSEVASAVMGVHVIQYKARAFLVSSMYVGLAGVLLALGFRHVVPDTFGLDLSADYLAMIVLGGLGSVAGSIIGAFFITALPLV